MTPKTLTVANNSRIALKAFTHLFRDMHDKEKSIIGGFLPESLRQVTANYIYFNSTHRALRAQIAEDLLNEA
jgi:hypothetical protein